jgi:2-polyprenyl-3-methyl-5-hydroxy-6-metoxy-1,4-benzoquinol methylase
LARLGFALEMLWARFRRGRRHCPYCRSCLHHRLQRKWLLIEARQCVFCGLIFRYPTDAPDKAARFYEDEYKGEMDDYIPGAERAAALRASHFQGTFFDRSSRLGLLRHCYAGGKVLDFGCSWGFATAQLIDAGLDAQGYELSRSRAELGRKALGVPITTDWPRLVEQSAQAFSLIYADHVLEHLCDLHAVLEDFARLLAPPGRLVLFVPNGGGRGARALGVRWGPFLGESHTIAFTAAWFLANLPRHGFAVEVLGSTPDGIDSLPDGDELICVARRVSEHRAGPTRNGDAVLTRESPCADLSAASTAPGERR